MKRLVVMSFFCFVYSLLAFVGFVFFTFVDLYELGITDGQANAIIAWCAISGFLAFLVGWVFRLVDDILRIGEDDSDASKK